MSNAIQYCWQPQERPLVQTAPGEFHRRAAKALSEDPLHKAAGPATASILVACFGLFLFVSQTVIGRIGSTVGIGAGISMAYRVYRLIRTHPCYQVPSGSTPTAESCSESKKH